MSKQRPVIINSRKLDGTISRSWSADLIEETAELFQFAGVFDTEIIHPQLGVIRRNTVSCEYFWKLRWFSVFRFHEPEGTLRNFYCNVNLPPSFENGVLDFVDLDLDILVQPDFSFEVLDQDEFVQNSEKYSYSKEIILGSRRTIEELKNLIKTKEFPFHAELPASQRIS